MPEELPPNPDPSAMHETISKWVKDALRDMPVLPENFHYEMDVDTDGTVVIVSVKNTEHLDMEL
jgi:hypothetical protein